MPRNKNRNKRKNPKTYFFICKSPDCDVKEFDVYEDVFSAVCVWSKRNGIEYLRSTPFYTSNEQEIQERTWLWHMIKRKIDKQFRPVWLVTKLPPTSLVEWMDMIDLFFKVLPKLVIDDQYSYQLQIGRDWQYNK